MALTQLVGFGLGKQSAKGAAATTFSVGRMTNSNTTPIWEESQPSQGEHIGISGRASLDTAAAFRIGYSVPIRAAWRMYPNMIGDALLLAGFTVSTGTVTDTAAYPHTFTLADRKDALWGSVYHAVGEGTVGSGRYARTIKDVRFSSLGITASHTNGISVEAAGTGIQDAASAASPTLNSEPTAIFSTSSGSLTSTGITNLSAAQTHKITITNTLGEGERQLHGFLLEDLPLINTSIAGEMQGMLWTEAQWKELLYASGTAPSSSTLTMPETRLQWSFASNSLITGAAATKYSIAFDIAVATVNLAAVDIAAGGLVRVNAAYKMIDRSASAPITITLVNGKSSY